MKGNRQEKILEIIAKKVVSTQEDLQSALLAEGFDVTQSTVSRDIKELRLIKGHDANGNYRYLSAKPKTFTTHTEQHYKMLIMQSVMKIDFASNNIVVKCHSGMASGAAVALDAIFPDRMLGTLAGDDTILIITRTEAQAISLATELKNLSNLI